MPPKGLHAVTVEAAAVPATTKRVVSKPVATKSVKAVTAKSVKSVTTETVKSVTTETVATKPMTSVNQWDRARHRH